MNTHSQVAHHPDEARLKAFSRGFCDRSESILLETHLHFCGECGEKLRLLRVDLEVEFLKVEDLLSLHPSHRQDLLTKIIEKLDNQDEDYDFANLGIPPSIYADLPDRRVWRWLSFWPSKGKVALLVSDINSPYKLFIGVLSGNHKTPRHSHKHDEQTIPLLGDYLSDGRLYRPGDWSEVKVGEQHEPSSVAGGSCICLIRSHHDGFYFTGWSWWRNILLGLSKLLGKLQSSNKASRALTLDGTG